MPKVQMTTLGYIETRESYLMLHRVKKEQDVNEGKWIGIGGKFEYGESPEECMIREAKEETGLAVTSMKFRGFSHSSVINRTRNISACIRLTVFPDSSKNVMKESFFGCRKMKYLG